MKMLLIRQYFGLIIKNSHRSGCHKLKLSLKKILSKILIFKLNKTIFKILKINL